MGVVPAACLQNDRLAVVGHAGLDVLPVGAIGNDELVDDGVGARVPIGVAHGDGIPVLQGHDAGEVAGVVTDEVAPAAIGGAIGAHPQSRTGGGSRGAFVGGDVGDDVPVHVDGVRYHFIAFGGDGLEGLGHVDGLHVDGIVGVFGRLAGSARGGLGCGIVARAVLGGQGSAAGNRIQGQLVVDVVELGGHGHRLFLILVDDNGGHLLGDGGALGRLGHGQGRGVAVGFYGVGDAADQGERGGAGNNGGYEFRCLHDASSFHEAYRRSRGRASSLRGEPSRAVRAKNGT